MSAHSAIAGLDIRGCGLRPITGGSPCPLFNAGRLLPASAWFSSPRSCSCSRSGFEPKCARLPPPKLQSRPTPRPQPSARRRPRATVATPPPPPAPIGINQNVSGSSNLAVAGRGNQTQGNDGGFGDVGLQFQNVNVLAPINIVHISDEGSGNTNNVNIGPAAPVTATTPATVDPSTPATVDPTTTATTDPVRRRPPPRSMSSFRRRLPSPRLIPATTTTTAMP